MGSPNVSRHCNAAPVLHSPRTKKTVKPAPFAYHGADARALPGRPVQRLVAA